MTLLAVVRHGQDEVRPGRSDKHRRRILAVADDEAPRRPMTVDVGYRWEV